MLAFPLSQFSYFIPIEIITIFCTIFAFLIVALDLASSEAQQNDTTFTSREPYLATYILNRQLLLYTSYQILFNYNRLDANQNVPLADQTTWPLTCSPVTCRATFPSRNCFPGQPA